MFYIEHYYHNYREYINHIGKEAISPLFFICFHPKDNLLIIRQDWLRRRLR